MNAKYGLIIKRGNDSTVNTFTRWNIACVNIPFKAGGSTKSPAKRDWFDEHGEDVYIPSKLMFEAYDVEFEVACVIKGNIWNLSQSFEKIDSFKKWLTGNDTSGGSGAELKVYSPYSTIGRQGCYLVSISDEDPHLQLKTESGNIYKENVLTFKVKFRVTDPMTNIELS